MVPNDSVDEDFCEGLDGKILVVRDEVSVLRESVYNDEYGVVSVPYGFVD